MIVSPPTRAELGEHTPILQKLTALPERLFLLVAMVPVLVAEHEIRLTGQCQQRDLVQDCVHPETLDVVFHDTLILVAASVLRRGELDIDLLGGSELEGLEEGEVGLIEVWALFL
jgi:hypothetical protein